MCIKYSFIVERKYYIYKIKPKRVYYLQVKLSQEIVNPEVFIYC